MNCCLRTSYRVLLLACCWVGVACQSDDDATTIAPTRQEQMIGTWGLSSIDAAISVEGEELAVYLAKMAESYGLSPAAVVVAVLLIENQASQQLIGRDPSLTLSGDQGFELQRAGDSLSVGTWQLSPDEQQLQLFPQTDAPLAFAITAFDENKITLVLDNQLAIDLSVPEVPEQVQAFITMDWERRDHD